MEMELDIYGLGFRCRSYLYFGFMGAPFEFGEKKGIQLDEVLALLVP